jgi:hypothetical protein
MSMNETTWTADEVQGFVARIGEFYGELSEAEQHIFADMLRDRVQDTAEVSGYMVADQTLPTDVLSRVVSEYLLAHANAAR